MLNLISRRLVTPAFFFFHVIAGGSTFAAPSALTRLTQGAESSHLLEFEGSVLEADGSPASGAVVVSSAGGRVVTDANGRFRLKVEAALAPESVQITAVSASNGNHVSSRTVPLPTQPGSVPVAPFHLSQTASCQYDWLPTFGNQPELEGTVLAMVVFDDGSGPTLYVSGSLSTPDGTPVKNIAKWTGTDWVNVGSGANNDIALLTVFDNGSGAALYAAGDFTSMDGMSANRIAKWDGQVWTSLGSGLNQAAISLTSHDDGTGTALYVGGFFSSAGGVPANRIARWNGSSWSALGTGMNQAVLSLASFDDGRGPALFAGGRFTTAGGTAAARIAKWNGSAWSAVGTGFNERVRALTSYDDGTGPALYAGGQFTQSGSLSTNRIARWNGSNWSAFDNGIASGPPNSNSVGAFAVFDGGTGPELFAIGTLSLPGAPFRGQLAKWSGSSWVTVNSQEDPPSCMAIYNDGTAEALLVGGSFDQWSGVLANKISEWDGQNWSSFAGQGTSTIPAGEVSDLAVFDDGNGRSLYAAGFFLLAGDTAFSGLARWNNTAWIQLPLPPSFTSGVSALHVFDDGTGEALYAARGSSPPFVNSDGIVAKWDGTNWTVLNTGFATNPTITSFTSFDDGTGEALYASGRFPDPGGAPESTVLEWDGTNWSSLVSLNSQGVDALTTFDDGSGSALYAAGDFSSLGGISTIGIARWDGVNWLPLGAGLGNFSVVNALAVFDDGSGPGLYVGGRLATAGGTQARDIARWDGSAWSPVGGGVDSFGAGILEFAVFNEGNGDALYAAGVLTIAGGVAVNNIARWDGSAWSALGGGLDDEARAMAVYDDGSGPALFVGGVFSSVPGSGDRRMAKWGCAALGAYSNFCYGDGGDQSGCTDCPCGNNAPLGTVAGCVNSASRCAQLTGDGTPSVSNDTMRFRMTGGTTSSFALLVSGASRAPANAANPCFGTGSGLQSPAFDGLRCVVQSVLRHGTRMTDASGDVGYGTNGWGPPHGPSGGLIAQGGFLAGQTRHYQVVYRDDVALNCMRGQNTSQGISVTFEP